MAALTLELSEVTYTYPGGTHPAIEDVTVRWHGPGLRVVTGPLGSGCSTLLLVGAGLAPRVMGGTRRGEVSVLGADLAVGDAAAAAAGRVALLLPTPWTQLSGMTYRVRDEIAFGPANLGWPIARIDESVRRVVELLNLEHLVERDPGTLSGGELQCVMLGGLLAMEPDVLFLDEPCLELAPRLADYVYDVLREIANSRLVVLATNDLDRVVSRADTVLVLHRGRVVTEGEPGRALRSPPAVQLGVTTTIGEVMRGGGAPVLPLDVEAAVRFLSAP